MEVEFESIPLRILELFKFYLSDQEIKSVIASCPKSDWTLNGCMSIYLIKSIFYSTLFIIKILKKGFIYF